MQAKLPGGLTAVTKIIQLISLADVMLTNQALKYTNHTSAFYRQENTLTRQVPPKLSRGGSTASGPCLPDPAKKTPHSKEPPQSAAKLLSWHLFYFLFKETISNDPLIDNVKCVWKKEYSPPGQMKRLRQQNAMSTKIITEEWGIRQQEVIKASVSSKHCHTSGALRTRFTRHQETHANQVEATSTSRTIKGNHNVLERQVAPSQNIREVLPSLEPSVKAASWSLPLCLKAPLPWHLPL